MAYEGWIEYNGAELINMSRTAQLARALGIDSVRTSPASVQWIQDTLGDEDYGDVTTAPWYDSGVPASAEFGGVLTLAFAGLDDSMWTREGSENTGDGGTSTAARNGRLPLVANVVLVGSTERGVEYGKRWLDRILTSRGSGTFCSGAELRYFRYAGEGAPVAHRRDVKLTRGARITSKRTRTCATSWVTTFTLTADDSYEYGEESPSIAGLGGVVSGPGLVTSGSTVLTEGTCPRYDYSPIFDPLYPALIPAPSAPDFYPSGWSSRLGTNFTRYWARVKSVEPSALNVVPIVTLTATTEARMVRVSFWDRDSLTTDQCDPLFSAIVTYLPPNLQFTLDGEQRASYVWDGASPLVRRADSVVFGPDASPVEWAAFNDASDILVTLDVFAIPGGLEGGGTVRAAVAFVPKSD